MPLQKVQNYLVPAAGSVRGYDVSTVFSATPFPIDFRNQELDGQPFTPSGVFVDNSAGLSALVITVKDINFTISVPAGARLQTQYPAPPDQKVEIVGNGQATVVFVDFPVIPFNPSAGGGGGGGGAVTIADGADVAQGSTTDAAGANTEIGQLKQIAAYAIGNIGYATDGTPLPSTFNTLPQTLTYTGSVLNTIAKTNGVNTWTQTYTYTGSNLTGISGWVKT